MPYSIKSCSCVFFLHLPWVYCCLFWTEEALPSSLCFGLLHSPNTKYPQVKVSIMHPQCRFISPKYQSSIFLSAGSELLWWAPSSREKDICSVNQKWQFITVLWDREGKRGKWSWTLHYGGTVVSHYSPRNPDLQFFANECQLCCPSGFVWRWRQDSLNALGRRKASFCFYCGSGRGEGSSFILFFVLCVMSRWHSQSVHERNL